MIIINVVTINLSSIARVSWYINYHVEIGGTEFITIQKYRYKSYFNRTIKHKNNVGNSDSKARSKKYSKKRADT